ncbi:MULTISPECIES: alpha-mannosidase [unclassified Tolypothrix]|uniref:alpha-mannosidase n=1 Tax=unclassified Tolypothrix TaxID=2649714 RepID=UPI0005EAAE49|nr:MULTISPECIES: alpha-mannosidase [unclassified Tolypothrix]BAY88593.1 glycosyl hydrolase 38 protein [Microchaete diplosiphon NIES-3275]EKE97118.1 glycosyl hydrolase family 38 protein [Tolypothrix sp. PCC 7601]MBE9082651.1 alpha-mannosidase [Tolypothrix sp. LEGE 11397]UYD29265.1 alpha-mannosidase [Tolypothrix sp. PCC 7712]UYD34824.1 alpha-mannosidase [Tolypothrix sp. PCC 7601]
MTPPVTESHTKLISEAIEQLRSCCQVNLQSTWLYQESDCDITEVTASNLSTWNPVQLNAKGHIAWTTGKQVLWLAQKFVIPQDLQGYLLAGLSLRLALLWWADAAEIYVNGKLVLEGDLFDCSPRVLLSQGVTPGEEFIVALRLVSPGHDNGALVRSLLVYESPDYNRPDAGFVANELAVVQLYLERFASEKLEVLAELVEEITNHRGAENTEKDKEEWETRLLSIRNHVIQSKIQNLKSKIYLLGHAHLDLAWLWPVSETWNAAQHTFESALKLQADFPELIFCHSTPALYAWIEEHRPDLFQAIQQAVAAGRWEVIGATWVEPDLNLIAGESIARQLLYGQRYIEEKFGKLSPIVWVPDSFGFCATLPQFFVNAGVEYFVTQKLQWNDTTKFDYGVFWWRSPDGSEVFSLMSAAIGEGIDPVKMANYAYEWETKTGLKDALWLPGVGDHGGGPTRDMLETAQRWQTSPFFPDLEFTTAEKYLQQIKETISHNHHPVWDDELYLEFHRGCYTTHGDQKRWNRRCEGLLYQAELFASLANISCGVEYPKVEIETAWKQLLFQQFHDILPGSSITQVYVDALPQWQQVEEVGTKILQGSLLAIASHITLPQPPQPNSLPVVVFNSLNWQRSEVISVSLPTTATPNQQWQVYDVSGKELPSQIIESSTLLFFASDIPSVGYRLFWLVPTSSLPSSPQLPSDWVLENEFLRVTVNPNTGDLASVFDKTCQREVLSGAGNQLQGFQDSGQYWDAWNIDPNYAQHPLPPTTLKSIEWLEKGAVQSRLRVVRQLGNSEFCQDYILSVGEPLLKIATTVNWRENHVLVKAAFPLNLEADFATYEIPCGAIRRTTKPKTPAEKAKWEVPALRWADLTEEATAENSPNPNYYGVSLLNDCKYGYDSQPNQLRLTLLRSPNWPNPQADKGFHEFTYALYPHTGSWESAHTVKRGYELNIPLQVIIHPLTTQHSATPVATTEGTSATHWLLSTPTTRSFLNLSADNLILMTLKQAEDDSQQFIVRCYECHGDAAKLSLQSDIGLILGDGVDLLERSTTTEFSSRQENLNIQPWKIASFKMKPGN